MGKLELLGRVLSGMRVLLELGGVEGNASASYSVS